MFFIRDSINGDRASGLLSSGEVALERIAGWVVAGEALPGEFSVTELDEGSNIVRHFGVPGHPDHADPDAVQLRRAAERFQDALDDFTRTLRDLTPTEPPAESSGLGRRER